MERKKYIFLIIINIIFIISFGQNNARIYSSYINSNMSKWETTLISLEKTYNSSNSKKVELLNYYYGLIAYCIEQNKDDKSEQYIKKSENIIEDLINQKYSLSMLYAYKSAIIGFKIGISPYKAPFIGYESLEYANKSKSFDVNNYFTYIQLGNIAYYSPEIFGGSKTLAIKYYIKALNLIENNEIQLINNWNYLNLLATIINAYDEQKNYILAKEYCIKTLNIEPNFKWVKNELYPKVLRSN